MGGLLSWHYEDMNKNNNSVTITAVANGFRIDDGNEFTKHIFAGNSDLACDIACDIIGESALFNTLVPYLDAGCELVDIERDLTDGLIVINALRNGCDVGEDTFGGPALEGDIDLVAVFDSLPNLYN